jgi:DNA-binding MarR family transcriptional regulator
MEDFTIRRRNLLRHHYTLTSNVLLFGYKDLSDAAKVTYQVIDSFDWSDSAGLRKGFAHPSIGRLAEIRTRNKRSIRRHLAELEKIGLITRRERPGRPSLLVIEDPSAEETKRYLAGFGGKGEDTDVRPPRTEMSAPVKENKEEERATNVNEIKSNRGEGRDCEHISDAIAEVKSSLNGRRRNQSPAKARREYLAQQMLEVLGDRHSLGCYRRIAERCPPHLIYETLGLVKEMAQEGRVRRSRGALFVEVVKRRSGAAYDHSTHPLRCRRLI